MTSVARRRRGPRTGAPSIKELSFGVSSAENERDAVARFEPFAGYLTRKLGVPVHVLWSSDYAAVIQALKSNRIQFARIGAANYALGRKVMGDRIEPVGTDQAEDGSTGYYSVVVVRADSPYHSLADLRGKILAWADPNSGSGYAVPLYYMKKQGIDPATFFSNTPFSRQSQRDQQQRHAYGGKGHDRQRLDARRLEIAGQDSEPALRHALGSAERSANRVPRCSRWPRRNRKFIAAWERATLRKSWPSPTTTTTISSP